MLHRLHHLISQMLGNELDQKIKQYFISGAYQSILLQAAIAIITFCSALLVARITGDKGFGIYTTVFTWISIWSVGATLGLDDLVLKQIPIYKQKEASANINALIRWTTKWGLLSGVLVAVILLLLSKYSTINGLYQYYDYYCWAVWCIPLFVLMHIGQATLRGLKLMWWGQFAEKFVQPIAFFALLVICYLLYGSSMTDYQAIIARTLSFVVVAIVALYLLYRYTKEYLHRSVAAPQQQWTKSCLYFAATSLLYIINTRVDILFLSFYEVPVEEIAYYNAALKLSDIALIPFAVLYTVTAPVFAELFAQKNMKKLQLFYTKTTRLACLLIGGILLGLVVTGNWLLALFGTSFQAAYPILLILCVVKFIHVAVGPANYLMMMIGLERAATYILLLSVGITFLLNIIFIPWLGSIGAAYATLGGLVVFELLVTIVVYKQSGIMPTILGSISNKE